MRPPSAALMSSLRELHLYSVPDASDSLVAAIDAIAEEAHPAVALALAPLVLVPSSTIANAAARALHRVLTRLDEKGILWIAREGRSFDVRGGPWYRLWWTIEPTAFDQWDKFGEMAVGLFCIGSTHSNGYVRQACLQRLVKYSGSLTMAFLLVRCNDWVRPIRNMARHAVLSRLRDAAHDQLRCQELLDNLMLTEQVERWGRDDNRPIREAIEHAFATNPLVWVLKHPREGSRFSGILRLHKFTLEQCAEDPFSFLEKTLSYPYGAIRLWAAREISKRLSGEELQALVEIMKKDSFAMVRYEAVFAIATKLPPLDSSTLIPFLYDPSPEVRFLASHYLTKNKFDVRAHYLTAIKTANDKDLQAIVVSLGEHGKPGDETVVAPFAKHPNPQVRRAFVYTTGKLRRDVDLTWLFEALQDPHKLVIREAARQIESRIHVVDPPVIERWFQTERRVSMKREALRIGAKMELWQALVFLLRAARVENPTIRGDLERELLRWGQRFVYWYHAPSADMLAQLEEAHAAAHGKIDEARWESIGSRFSKQKKSSP